MIDPLSDLLRSVRLTGGVFLDARLSAPWSIASRVEPGDCTPFMLAPTQLIAYHFIISGSLRVEIPEEPAIDVNAGEIVLLPRNDPHTLASAAGLQAINAHDLIQPSEDGGLLRIHHGGGGHSTHLVCGFLGTEEIHNPLLATLPKLLKLNVREGTSGSWIEASIKFAANELTQGRFASSSVMSRLSELLFVEAVRQYSSSLDDRHPGWLNGLKDQQVGRALSLIHHDLSKPCAVDFLAKEVGMSRSAFTDRFSGLVGLPPIRYQNLWRLQSARIQLRETRKTVAQIAYSVGYESEEAFGRAFKKEFGMPPTAARESRAQK
jgi:AraC-like DNA-binding protein